MASQSKSRVYTLTIIGTHDGVSMQRRVGLVVAKDRQVVGVSSWEVKGGEGLSWPEFGTTKPEGWV